MKKEMFKPFLDEYQEKYQPIVDSLSFLEKRIVHVMCNLLVPQTLIAWSNIIECEVHLVWKILKRLKARSVCYAMALDITPVYGIYPLFAIYFLTSTQKEVSDAYVVSLPEEVRKEVFKTSNN